MTQDLYQARYKTAQEIRRHGAVGNLQDGPTIRTHGIATRLIAWPGNPADADGVLPGRGLPHGDLEAPQRGGLSRHRAVT